MLYCERRLLLQALALGSAAAAIGAPLRAYAAVQNAQRALPRGKYPENFLVHNDLPWALETRRSRYGIAPITPQSAFFVRNNLPTPPASIVDNRPQWRFEIAGWWRIRCFSGSDTDGCQPVRAGWGQLPSPIRGHLLRH